jgi:hypothetical protein
MRAGALDTPEAAAQQEAAPADNKRRVQAREGHNATFQGAKHNEISIINRVSGTRRAAHALIRARATQPRIQNSEALVGCGPG